MSATNLVVGFGFASILIFGSVFLYSAAEGEADANAATDVSINILPSVVELNSIFLIFGAVMLLISGFIVMLGVLK